MEVKPSVLRKQFIFDLINKLIEKNCYIKPYGRKVRVMDEFHNPEVNLVRSTLKILLAHGIVMKEGVVWKLAVDENPFEDYTKIKLSVKVVDTKQKAKDVNLIND